VSGVPKPRCARCPEKECSEGKDCFDLRDKHRTLYEDERIARIHRAATAIEGRHYCEAPRLQEIVYFARELGCGKVGLVFCVGLSDEARIVDEVLRQHFDVYSVCCKACAIDKKDFGLEQIDPDRFEVICNSAGQADLLNRAGSELNIVCGLCVGHDAVFSAASEAPVVTFIAKDRVLAHNPAGAVYCQYVRKNLLEEEG